MGWSGRAFLLGVGACKGQSCGELSLAMEVFMEEMTAGEDERKSVQSSKLQYSG